MNIFNFRIVKHVLQPTCTLITGDKGAGKSSLFALIAEQARKQDIRCFSQYPYEDAYVIPMQEKIVNGVKRYDINKQWLYETDFTDSVVMLDEIKTVWNARAYNKWTGQDEEFFNFLRKFNTRLFCATQYMDGVDINVKRACDETWYLTKGILEFTHIEASSTKICKVADRQTEVVGRMFRKGMRKIVWDICEVPIGNFLFWRKPYYKKFDSYFTFDKKKAPELVSWADVYEFNAS